jgi:hypothetical protein
MTDTEVEKHLRESTALHQRAEAAEQRAATAEAKLAAAEAKIERWKKMYDRRALQHTEVGDRLIETELRLAAATGLLGRAKRLLDWDGSGPAVAMLESTIDAFLAEPVQDVG